MAARPITILAIALTSAAIAGCGGSDSGGAAATSGRVAIASFKYAPAAITVKAGAPVTFTNRDSSEHTATSDTEGVFDTDTLHQNDAGAVRVAKPGRYPYHCAFHAFMHGVLVVR